MRPLTSTNLWHFWNKWSSLYQTNKETIFLIDNQNWQTFWRTLSEERAKPFSSPTFGQNRLIWKKLFQLWNSQPELGSNKLNKRKVTNDATINVKLDPQVLLKKYEREIRDLKQELAMHDTLANRGRINYEPYTPQQYIIFFTDNMSNKHWLNSF